MGVQLNWRDSGMPDSRYKIISRYFESTSKELVKQAKLDRKKSFDHVTSKSEGFELLILRAKPFEVLKHRREQFEIEVLPKPTVGKEKS